MGDWLTVSLKGVTVNVLEEVQCCTETVLELLRSGLLSRVCRLHGQTVVDRAEVGSQKMVVEAGREAAALIRCQT